MLTHNKYGKLYNESTKHASKKFFCTIMVTYVSKYKIFQNTGSKKSISQIILWNVWKHKTTYSKVSKTFSFGLCHQDSLCQVYHLFLKSMCTFSLRSWVLSLHLGIIAHSICDHTDLDFMPRKFIPLKHFICCVYQPLSR